MYHSKIIFSAVFPVLLMLPWMGCSQSPEVTPVSDYRAGSDFYFPPAEEQGEIYQTESLDFFVQTVVSDLDVPWGMVFLPDSSMLVTERSGTLRQVRKGELLGEPVTGVPEVRASGQGGLLDIALHPDYGENGWIYLSYSKPGPGGAHTAIMRARLDGNTLTDQEEIYEGHPFSNAGQHFGGRIAFDGAGYLYFSIGDRGEMDMAQDITTSNGNVFRLYDDGSIPEDNPFVGGDGLDEIFSYGHRNIQGMAVHPQTREIWTNEHGARGGDEINHPQKGLNYGWPEITHGVNYNGSIISEDTARVGMEQPVLHWTPSIAPSGMEFVSSDRYPAWEDNILNGALAGQLIARVVLDGDRFTHEERILEGYGRIRNIRQAPDGYIYFSNESNGTINRIVPVE